MAELDRTISVIESWLKQPVLTPPPINELYNALELLKKQKPTIQSNGSCPNCGLDFENGDLDFSSLDSQKFYCPNCGQAVKCE